jgi:hypothetical protein
LVGDYAMHERLHFVLDVQSNRFRMAEPCARYAVIRCVVGETLPREQ